MMDVSVAAAKVLMIALTWLQYLIIASAVISWLDPDPRNRIVMTVRGLTDPLYRPFRRLLGNFDLGPIDLAPMLVLMTIIFCQILLSQFLGTRVAF